MAQLGTEKNIEIITRASILDVRQEKAGHLLRIKTRPRYVIPEKCIGCGLCAENCPAKITELTSKHDTSRKAIYLPSFRAIPRGYVIDPGSCAFFTTRSCRKCEEVCPRGAIDLEQESQEFEVRTRAVILSPGAATFDPALLPSFGYDSYQNVITGLEMEILLSPTGPTGGELKRPSDRAVPERIAWIQCVGSRQTNIVDRPFCSSICCMASIKQALSVKQACSPSPEAFVFYMDIRAHQKAAERYLNLAVRSGVKLIPSRIHCIEKTKDDRLRIKAWLGGGKCIQEDFDMIVLSAGLNMGREHNRLAAMFGIETNRFGFTRVHGAHVTRTNKESVYACGTFTDPKSIQGAVIEGSAAAAFLCSDLMLSPARKSRATLKQTGQDIRTDLEPPAIGVFICECGKNIGQTLNVKRIGNKVRSLPGVRTVKLTPFACSPDSLELLARTIEQKGLNRVVIAACSPKSHEQLFRKALQKAGIDKSLLCIANIREQVAWVHANDREGAEKRAIDQIRMAIARASRLKPVKLQPFPVKRRALVIGGGIAGLTAAKVLSDRGIGVSLIEKEDRLGGNARSILETWRGIKVGNFTRNLISEVMSSRNVDILLQAELLDMQGGTGNLTSLIRHQGDDNVKIVAHGAVVVATGAREAKPANYHYGDHPGILTHQELDERIMKEGMSCMEAASSVVFIQCVGSCNEHRPYCSRVCCTHSVTRALMLKERMPELSIHILYRHMRTYGQRDDFYTRARGLGIKAIRFEEDHPPQVRLLTTLDLKDQPSVLINVQVKDPLTDEILDICPDYLILASAIEPDIENNKELSKKLGVPLGEDGFFQEAHAKLRPVELRRDGFFVAGLAHYPKEIEESVSQAAAAAGKAALFLSQQSITPDRLTAEIEAERCDGCTLCLDVCTESALKLVEYVYKDELKKIVELDSSLCSGCGACTSSCPQQAIGIPGFMPRQITEQIRMVALNGK